MKTRGYISTLIWVVDGAEPSASAALARLNSPECPMKNGYLGTKVGLGVVEARKSIQRRNVGL
jgi:hypothetical protein